MTADVAVSVQSRGVSVAIQRLSAGVRADAGIRLRRVGADAAGHARRVTLNAVGNQGHGVVDVEVLPVRVIEAEEYRGAYTAIPEFDAQTFETKDKLMTNDFTVKSIPVYDTTNPAGGITIYIGGQFDG